MAHVTRPTSVRATQTHMPGTTSTTTRTTVTRLRHKLSTFVTVKGGLGVRATVTEAYFALDLLLQVQQTHEVVTQDLGVCNGLV